MTLVVIDDSDEAFKTMRFNGAYPEYEKGFIGKGFGSRANIDNSSRANIENRSQAILENSSRAQQHCC